VRQHRSLFKALLSQLQHLFPTDTGPGAPFSQLTTASTYTYQPAAILYIFQTTTASTFTFQSANNGIHVHALDNSGIHIHFRWPGRSPLQGPHPLPPLPPALPPAPPPRQPAALWPPARQPVPRPATSGTTHLHPQTPAENSACMHARGRTAGWCARHLRVVDMPRSCTTRTC